MVSQSFNILYDYLHLLMYMGITEFCHCFADYLFPAIRIICLLCYIPIEILIRSAEHTIRDEGLNVD